MRGARQRWIARQRIIARGKDEFHGKVSRCTAKRELHGKVCRAVLTSRTIKTVLPGQALSCGLYRASTHGNAFAVHAEAFSVQLACMATPAFLIVPVLFLGAGGDTSRSLPCCCNLQMKFVSFQSGRSPNPENKSSIWNQSCTNLKRRLNGRLLPFSAKHSKAGDTNRQHITLRATLEESSAVPASLA
jgi:hypothetical protein